MNKLKFRAWIHDAPQRRRKEAMFYQNDQYLSSFINRIYSKYLCNHPSQMPFQLEERLMQYTGLKDRNGKEVYQNDICYVVDINGKEIIGRVFLQDCCHVLIDKFNTCHHGLMHCVDLEVIGNIYQNPELLENNNK